MIKTCSMLGMHKLISRYLLPFTLFFLCVISTPSVSHAAKIVELSIKGPIGPATAEYIVRGIDNNQDAQLILVVLDTPGGLDQAIQSIMKKFLRTKVPVVTYVSPNGAQVTDEGVFLLYASTLVAMAPDAHLGGLKKLNLGAKNKGLQWDNKIVNETIAALRSLALLRGRDAHFVEQGIGDTKMLTAPEALKAGAINYIAKDQKDLLAQLNAKVVIQNEQNITLNTLNPQINNINPDWYIKFLTFITYPTVAYLLILLGIYGIFFELMNPGHIMPGIIGTIAMMIALYALQWLPVNYAGLGLIIVSIVFIVAEGVTPSYGVLGLVGTIAFLLGSIMLMNTEQPVYQIGWPAIWGMALANILIFVVLLGMVVRRRNQLPKDGLIVQVGAKGRSLGAIQREGQAIIRGEIWRVRSALPIDADKPVRVTSISGLSLEIEEDKNL